MRENRSYGSVRGAARKGGPYRDHIPIRSVKGFPRYFVGSGLYVVSRRITASSRRVPSEAVGRGLFSLFSAWFPGGATILRPYFGCYSPLSEPCLRY